MVACEERELKMNVGKNVVMRCNTSGGYELEGVVREVNLGVMKRLMREGS